MDLAEGLERVLAGIWPDGPVAVEGLARLSGGASRETWSFDARHPDGTQDPLILRRDPPGAPRAGGMALEAALLEEAARAGVPVPRLVVASDDPAVLGSSFVLVSRIEGETIPRRVLRESALAGARPGLAAECGRVLARIHRGMDRARLPGLEPQDPMAQYRVVLDTIGWPSPTFELAFRWLEDNRPAPGPPCVVHGDFRNGNLIVGPDGLRAVLDWEMAHVGDPLEDLSWLCVKSWRFGVDLPVGGFGTYDQLLSAYEQAGGAPVDRDALRWWEVLGNLKWGVICMMQASAHTSGLIRSVELAAIGRRVCEVEWDLLDLLRVEAVPIGPEPQADRPVGMHGRPEAAELVEAVRGFVEGDVIPATEGRVRFHARVAVNVLRMIERELTLGPAQARFHAAGLPRFGVGTETELAQSMRQGELDDRDPELRLFLAQVVRSKLEVANPGYLDGPQPPS